MRLTNLLLILALIAGLGIFSVSRIAAQSGTQTCPGYGQGYGMMGGPGGHGYMMQGMHGPADTAYMQSLMSMHRGLYGRTFSGDPDRDFLSMAAPQYEAMIGMARTELQYGKDPKVRALAQDILKSQQAHLDRMTALQK